MVENEKEKRVPNLRFKGFTDDWMQEKLSNLYSFSNGINTAKENYGKGRKMISVTDILSEEYLYYNNINTSVNVSKSIEKNNKVEKGDLIFVRSSETKKEVGWVKAYRDNVYSLFSGFSIRGSKENNFNSFFVELSLNYSNRKQIESKANGSTRFNIGQKNLQNIVLLHPEIKEQNSISRIIESIDSIITLEQEKLRHYKQLKKGLLRKLFPRKGQSIPSLRFEGFYDNWREVSLSEIFTLKNGYSFKSSTYDNKGDYKILTISNVKGKTYVDASDVNRIKNVPKKIKSHQVLEVGDILISMTGNVGRVSVVNEENTLLNQRVGILVSKLSNYDRYLLLTILQDSEFERNMINKGQGAAQLNIGKKDIESYTFMMPISLDEQQKIGKLFKRLNDIINHSQLKSTEYVNIKNMLLNNLFV